MRFKLKKPRRRSSAFPYFFPSCRRLGRVAHEYRASSAYAATGQAPLTFNIT
jgi:hypothetical protein